MATVKNGKLLVVDKTGVVIGYTRSATLSISQGTEDITTKSDDDWEVHIQTLKNGTLSFEGLVTTGDTNTSASDLLAVMVGASASNTATYTFAPTNANVKGDIDVSFEGTLESFEVGADNQSPATLSGTIKINGAVTQTVTA